MKLSGRGLRSGRYFGRLGAQEQFGGIEASGLGRHSHGYLPSSDFLSLAQGGLRDRQPHTIVRHAKVLGCFRDKVWRQILFEFLLEPA